MLPSGRPNQGGFMRHISELREILRSQLPMDKRRLDCLAQMVISIIVLRSVNLTSLAKQIGGKAQLNSRYKRIQRLIHNWPAQTDWMGPWLLTWFFDPAEPISLTMDRTNWQFGKFKINFLVVGVAYRRMAIPIMWALLPKKGNSNFSERKALLDRVFKYIPKKRVKNILCDREFVGKVWFSWLQRNKIPFKIRIKDNYLALTTGGQETTVEALFHDLPRGQKKYVGLRLVTSERIKMYLTGSRLESGELMVVASDSQCENAIENYCERWEIENLFQCLKGRGFDFETTHITDHGRLSALMQVAAIAACWCIRTGEWLVEEGQTIKLKRHGRPTKSLFRHGLDMLADSLGRQTSWRTRKKMLVLWDQLITIHPVNNGLGVS
jgi:hypothetical protein